MLLVLNNDVKVIITNKIQIMKGAINMYDKSVYGFEIVLTADQSAQIRKESGVTYATLNRAMKSLTFTSYGEYYLRRRAIELGARKIVEIKKEDILNE